MQERAGQFGAEHTSAPFCITAPCRRVEGVVFDVQFSCIFFFSPPHLCSCCAVSSVHNFHGDRLGAKPLSSDLNPFKKSRSLLLFGGFVRSRSLFRLQILPC